MRRVHSITLVISLLTTVSARAATTLATPADHPLPDYPAASTTLSGHVTLRFAIDAHGQTQNLRVTQSDPPGVFDQAALAAVSRWRYHPRLSNGHPVDQPDNAVNLAFQPPEPEPIFKPPVFYTREAYAARQEGSVTVAFDITPVGLTTNVHVLTSRPPGVFDKNAMSAVSGWQYAATPANQPLLHQTADIAFTLADAMLPPIPARPLRLIYPAAAQAAGVMGNCNVGFWIEENGTTSDAHILSCVPSYYFETATLNAVRAATYKVESEPHLNRRRYHRLNVKFRFDGVNNSEASYLKPGQWVKLRFTRTANGHATNIEVVAQSSSDVRAASAVEQLRQTSLTPVMENGRSVEQANNIIIISGQR